MAIYTHEETHENLIDNSAKKERLFCKVNTERNTDLMISLIEEKLGL